MRSYHHLLGTLVQWLLVKLFQLFQASPSLTNLNTLRFLEVNDLSCAAKCHLCVVNFLLKFWNLVDHSIRLFGLLVGFLSTERRYLVGKRCFQVRTEIPHWKSTCCNLWNTVSCKCSFKEQFKSRSILCPSLKRCTSSSTLPPPHLDLSVQKNDNMGHKLS